LWPALASMIVATYLAHTGALDHDDPPAVAGAIAASVPAVVVLAPYVFALVGGFGLRAAPAVGVLVALLTAMAAPAVRLLLHPFVRFAPAASLGVGLICFLAGLLY